MQRRTFIKGTAAASLLGVTAINLEAETPRKAQHSSRMLSGKEFFLDIDYTTVNITGKKAVATAINGQIPGPTLVWQEGDTITLHVTNHLKKASSIHWHGIILPFQMDGVPGISYKGIAPGETFTYRFTVHQHGTYWYHSHSGYQEQTGMYGAIIVKPKKKEPFRYDRDYVVLLSDWSDEKPTSIYRKLKQMSDYYNFNQRTVGNFFSEVKQKGLAKAFKARKMWNQMRMSDKDLSDVTGYTYTYLMNGNNPATQFTALFKKGEKIRLRFINGSAMSIFDVRIPGLKMTVVAADGNHIKPVRVDEFRIGVAETYDVIVHPTSSKAYALFAQSIERSGYALGSLTPSSGLRVHPPKTDKPQPLTMVDMGMNMSKTGKQKGMKMPMKKYRWSAMEQEQYPITKLPSASGPQSTMKAMAPHYRLEDPGVGLRHNGRKVLTYADMKNRYSTRKEKRPDREIILHLTGNMERYMWSINGIKYADAKPLVFHYGERLRITFINDTMMNHPMHLHGMWSDLETGDDNHLVRKHTVLVQPGSKISYRVTVDAKGAWAYHCHLLYHMAGMFRKVVVV
ncbi:Multicopper oxidase [hydrothermal vent metagenome]|uniref:Multicopper oxidase n=1 Tax=hydrothermal vent metagenome TaxID=652676 RepID=A0A1W1C3E2_9ZZZZ